VALVEFPPLQALSTALAGTPRATTATQLDDGPHTCGRWRCTVGEFASDHPGG
jgi:uncharacterized cupin superfamily protein